MKYPGRTVFQNPKGIKCASLGRNPCCEKRGLDGRLKGGAKSQVCYNGESNCGERSHHEEESGSREEGAGGVESFHTLRGEKASQTRERGRRLLIFSEGRMKKEISVRKARGFA